MNTDFAGARWWRFDIHTHTPASYDYGRNPQQAGSTTRTPREWLLDYMRAEIDCVAVTDHNVGHWIDKLKEEYSKLKSEKEKPDGFRELYIFPGVEITVHPGVHLLALFDPSRGKSDIDALLGRLDLDPSPARPGDSCTSQSVMEAAQCITSQRGIAIPAHADSPRGVLATLPRQSLQQVLDCTEIVAAEILHIDKLQQSIPVRWSPVLGSDSHHPTGERGQKYPGSHFTWVKMGKPSIEGLRLALIDESKSSIYRSDQMTNDRLHRKDPNDGPNLTLRELEITEGAYIGRGKPLRVQFSPWMSAIIGGRGTGKSTLIEMLRIVFGRESEVPPKLHPQLSRYSEVRRSRGDRGALLTDTRISVAICKGSEHFRVRWNEPDCESLIEQNRKSGWELASGDVRSKFPIKVLSQQQILAIADDPDALLHLVDNGLHLDDCRAQEAKLRNLFLSVRSKQRALLGEAAEANRLRGELDDVQRQLKIFETSDYHDTLVAYRRNERQRSILDSRDREIATTVQKILHLAEEIEPTDLDKEVFDPHINAEQEVLEALQGVVAMQRKAGRDLELRARSLENEWSEQKERLQSSKLAQIGNDIQEKYQALQADLSASGVSSPLTYQHLIQRREVLENRIVELDSIKSQAHDLDRQASAILLDYQSLKDKVSTKRSEFLGEVLDGNEYIRITPVPYGEGASDQENWFRECIGRQDNAFEKDIWSSESKAGILSELYEGLPSDPRDRILEIKRRVLGIKQAIKTIRNGKPDSNRTKRFNEYVKKIVPEQLDRFELWWPRDALRVEYRRRSPTKWAPIQSGSPGQKAAAILAFILAHGKEPIVLDQPEDDLDNHLIYDLIVRQVQKMKRQRQLIIATHNPNIVVNGDAEMVVSMDFSKGQCVVRNKSSGYLQEPRVRDEICNVMEGGEQALRSRYKRLVRGDQDA